MLAISAFRLLLPNIWIKFTPIYEEKFRDILDDWGYASDLGEIVFLGNKLLKGFGLLFREGSFLFF